MKIMRIIFRTILMAVFLLSGGLFLLVANFSSGAESSNAILSNGLQTPINSIGDILWNLLIKMLQIIGGVSLLSFLVSIAQHFFAANDRHKEEMLKRIFVYSILGMITAIAGWMIFMR